MSKSHRFYILGGLLALAPAIPAFAFHGGGGGHGGGGHGGGGHVGGGGGFHGGGGGHYAGGGGHYVGGGAGHYAGGGVGHYPGAGHYAGVAPGHYAGGNFNRGNTFNNVNRGNTFNNANRSATFNNVNRSTTINNVNRMGYGGWHNNYAGYHSGWAHGYWNGHYPGGFGWRGYGYPGYWGGYGGGLGLGLGLGLGWGLSSWVMGPMLYNWGYSNYYNPYYGAGYGGPATVVVQQPIVYDYGQPIDSQAAPPDETVANQSVSTFDAAREAFKGGDYPKALGLVDQAIKTMPNDATLHEFRAQTLFALGRFEEAAAPLYAVLSTGPGWDWTTLISLYGDPDAYTQQLRALEAYCTQNPKSAGAIFVLAYQYLTEEHPEAAVRELQVVTALQPKDTLSAQLLQQLQQSQSQQAAGTTAEAPPPGAAPAPTAAYVPTGKEGTLDGSFTAQPDKDVTITLSFQPDGRFVWKVSRQGKDQSFAGKLSYENGILTLVQDQNNNTMVGNVNWADPGHFTFKVIGGGANDPGLSFAKAA
jgi:tetratricopeptide (TPR) repeat protein